MTRTRFDILNELRQWGIKLARTNNRLSKREIEAFHKLLREATTNGINDSDIDLNLKQGRVEAIPKPRYAEVDQWIS